MYFLPWDGKILKGPKRPGTFDGSERKRVNENRFETLFENENCSTVLFFSRLSARRKPSAREVGGG
tara:strand:- start:158 stop:355 length:198 start_codon:yes stop_codon:yes gene_type:complete